MIVLSVNTAYYKIKVWEVVYFRTKKAQSIHNVWAIMANISFTSVVKILNKIVFNKLLGVVTIIFKIHIRYSYIGYNKISVPKYHEGIRIKN